MHFSTPAKFENLEQVRTDHKTMGGAIILYRDVWSLFAISMMTPKLVHVPPHRSRMSIGMHQSKRTLWAGWWSLSGLFQTGHALAHNLSGGLDVTLIYADPALPRDEASVQEFRRRTAQEAQTIRWRSVPAVIASFLFMAGLIYGFIVYVHPFLEHLADTLTGRPPH